MDRNEQTATVEAVNVFMAQRPKPKPKPKPKPRWLPAIRGDMPAEGRTWRFTKALDRYIEDELDDSEWVDTLDALLKSKEEHGRRRLLRHMADVYCVLPDCVTEWWSASLKHEVASIRIAVSAADEMWKIAQESVPGINPCRKNNSWQDMTVSRLDVLEDARDGTLLKFGKDGRGVPISRQQLNRAGVRTAESQLRV